MPRNKTTKPKPAPERRNAPKGSTTKRHLVHHTQQSEEDLKALSATWGEPNANAVVRRALRQACSAEESSKGA